MKKQIFIYGMFIFCGIKCFCQIAPAHLKYFGYYLVDVGQISDPNPVPNNNYINEVASFTNLNQMAAFYPSENLVTRINLMSNLCSKPFLAVQEVLYYQIDNNAPSGRHLKLYADYQARWNTFKAINSSVFTPEKIGAFYMVDEPKWNNVSFDDLNVVSQMIKNDYPNIPILVIEAYSQINALQVPTSVDWVGFDRYTMFNPSTNASYLQNLTDIKQRRSTPNQKIFIVIDNNWIPAYANAGYAPENMDVVAQDYYNLAVSDPEIVGLLAWLWPSGVDQPAQIGARDLPQNVKNKNIQIGTNIKANYSPCAQVLALDTIKKNNIGTTPKDVAFSLAPNPVAHRTIVSFGLQQSSQIGLAVYDMFGKKVMDFGSKMGSAGKHQLQIDISSLPSGFYYVQLHINHKTQIEKLVVSR